MTGYFKSFDDPVYERVWKRVVDGMQQSWADAIRSQCMLLNGLCDSPIEAILCATLLARDDYLRQFKGDRKLILTTQVCAAQYPPDERLLVPQYKWNNFRVDLALRDSRSWFFIECDGHDFHERNSYQAKRDRSRDRVMQQAGIPILRFTGSEINADPVACADEVSVFVSEHIERSQEKVIEQKAELAKQMAEKRRADERWIAMYRRRRSQTVKPQ